MLSNAELETLAATLDELLESIRDDIHESTEGTPESGPMNPSKDSIAHLREVEKIRELIVNLQTWHVVVYDVAREYGGPEEGGWHYDWYHNPRLLLTINGPQAEAYHVAKAMNDLAKQERLEDRRPQGRFSVLGGDDDVYVVEETVGATASTERPHYE